MSLLALTPAGAQIVRAGDIATVIGIVACGWSDALPTTSLGETGAFLYGSGGAIRYADADDHRVAAVWQIQAGLNRVSGCYRQREVRLQLFGSAGDGFGARIEGELPISKSIPFAPKPEHMEVPRFFRLQAVAGVEMTNRDLLSHLGAERRHAWVGILGASPRLEFGWAGEPRLLARLIVTGRADAFGATSLDRVRPRLGFNLPLLVERMQVLGLLFGWDRVYHYAGDAELTRRTATLTVYPLPGGKEWITLSAQASDQRLEGSPRQSALGVHATLYMGR
jgi:hypothetical protein